MYKERGIAYNPDLEKNKTPLYRERQLGSHIGERLNALLSRTLYDIRDGKIFGLNEDEPFLEVMKSGVGHGNPSDKTREEAEVIGFLKIQNSLARKDTPDGFIMVSISPKGNEDSVYQHNFYDIFVRNGSRIEAFRYSAGLSWEEFGEKARELGFRGEPNDISFLYNPFEVKDLTPQEIHQFFHKEHEYLNEEDYTFIINKCLSSIRYYAQNPSSKSFNAALNKADYVRENLEDIKAGKLFYIDIPSENTDNWGSLPVRQVLTGCGFSGGAQESPYSVSNLAQDKYGPREFFCPHCGETNRRPKDQLIAKCQYCNKDVKCK